ncbi:hypothetical protein E4K64_36995 [Bradyrhizobium frederickii]|uniref:Uncharacterized protein n=1 Tax=Bradyrhizobium frederickii TaxID=2560054 RepID=A0A4Y9NKN9_9BRAD|nr:hypothetical protein E4K66_37045 [Bradyrhizobium frederickii]TFV68440.1 hypothetical protein E4K64_36995 [Bradyrhizobium frederickii]
MKQIEFAAAVHLTSDELEARDLTFGLAIRPGQSDCCTDRCLSLATPLANEATRLARARSIHVMRPASVLRRIIRCNSAMISRASTKVGTPASIAAIVTVSAFVSKSRPIIMRRAIVLADGIL